VQKAHSADRHAHRKATIQGKKIIWPTRQLHTIEYDLETTKAGLYRHIVDQIEAFHLADKTLEGYKPSRQERDEFKLGRQLALVGRFKSRLLKRLQSSIKAFRIFLWRALESVKAFTEPVHDAIFLDAASFRMTLCLLGNEDEDAEEATPGSLATEMDDHDQARRIIEALPCLDAGKYIRRKPHGALRMTSPRGQKSGTTLQASTPRPTLSSSI
jgi:hypothetical protein